MTIDQEVEKLNEDPEEFKKVFTGFYKNIFLPSKKMDLILVVSTSCSFNPMVWGNLCNFSLVICNGISDFCMDYYQLLSNVFKYLYVIDSLLLVVCTTTSYKPKDLQHSKC